MRTNHLALLVSLLAPACMDVPHRHYYNGDGGTANNATCDNPEVVTRDLQVASDADLDGLPAGCWQLQGKLTLNGSSLTSVAKLGQLAQVTDLEIGNTGLTKVDSAVKLAVSGGIYIHDNASLTDLGNLAPGADRIDSLRIENNAAITALGDNLATVKYVSNATTFLGNAKLATIDLHTAERLEGGLDIENNGVLGSVQLSALQSTANLTVRNNAALATLGLGALQYVHGSLAIDSNAQLDLGGAMTSTITSVDANLAITNNAHLTQLGQLAHTGNVLGTVTISGNAQLDYCPAREVGCCVPHAGYATIANNLTSQCNSGQHSWCYAQYGQCPYAY